MMRKILQRKRHERVPFLPEAGLCESSSSPHFYSHIFLPFLGTIQADRSLLPEGVIGRRPKRAAFCAFSRGSLSVEAAFAVPFFFMTVICMISIMNVYGQALDRCAALRDTAMTAALAAGSGSDEKNIDLCVPILFRPYFFPEQAGTAVVPCRACVRAWNGRDENTSAEGRDSSKQYVYLTDNKSVYHTSASCTHLDLSVHSVSFGSVSSLRNDYGQKYHKCEKCGAAAKEGVVFVASCGDCWHCSPECPALKRSIQLVDIEEVDGSLCQCSRCAQKDA